jgi:hypothetical protein
MDLLPPIQSAPTPYPTTVENTQEVGKEGSREVGREVSRETGKEGNTPLPQPASAPVPVFDLSVKPYRKDSFLFTDEEFEAMEDLKLELRRMFDLKSTKQDVARCAIGYLLEDYKRHGPASIVVNRLKGGK